MTPTAQRHVRAEKSGAVAKANGGTRNNPTRMDYGTRKISVTIVSSESLLVVKIFILC